MAHLNNENNNYHGHLGERVFCVEAIKRGLRVSEPINHESAYDFIVDFNGKLSRIQVKTSNRTFKNGNYTVLLLRGNSNKRKYTKEDIDFFAVWRSELNIWYIIPVENVSKGSMVVGKTSKKWSVYVDAWNLLKD